MMLADAHITAVVRGSRRGHQQAIVNAVLAATTVEGCDGIVADAPPGERLARALAEASY